MWNKPMLSSLLVLGLSLATFDAAHAARCEVDGARVVNVFQWEDGHIFVELDRAMSGCSCSMNSRAAFHKDENQKFFMAAALAALLSGKPVHVAANDVNGTCPIHANTARLEVFLVSQ